MSSSLTTHTLACTAPKKRRLDRRSRKLLTGLGILFTLVILALWWSSRTQIVDLGSDNQMHNSGVYTDWAKGNIIVLIRHAERCDRSPNPCLDDLSGITLEGSHAASEVGSAIQRLGMDNAQVLSSPQVRTRQTAHFMFGKAIASQDWLTHCDKGFAHAAFEHKTADHNLVLVTHSGCIDQLERQLNVPGGERSSAYASALFVSMGRNGKARILGQMNANEWHKLVSSTGK
ncbi:histidine phosphatase family protein [Pseudomonas rubra]|uniref:Histidine phosphatase family protein n=1 Tax=Pseudomonas rubra TaxID=2942627 RepID=A0ABT5PB22_9PSED|nr:histidine phosphatase family protein [Pseudomonas rubra]MDD1015507.1 histidine phosphatase family protein [Pseudomonas rubra]MDD1041651.1 histidine phosphatase family protein [Pseudomonas rubra]MDD1157105.1 histidine phosphatase family protein [Pseudomonas rubra]